MVRVSSPLSTGSRASFIPEMLYLLVVPLFLRPASRPDNSASLSLRCWLVSKEVKRDGNDRRPQCGTRRAWRHAERLRSSSRATAIRLRRSGSQPQSSQRQCYWGPQIYDAAWADKFELLINLNTARTLGIQVRGADEGVDLDHLTGVGQQASVGRGNTSEAHFAQVSQQPDWIAGAAINAEPFQVCPHDDAMAERVEPQGRFTVWMFNLSVAGEKRLATPWVFMGAAK